MRGVPEPTDPRRHQTQTERNLLIGAAAILILVGGGLILLLYGSGAWVSGVLCMSVAIALFVLLYAILKLFERLGGE